MSRTVSGALYGIGAVLVLDTLGSVASRALGLDHGSHYADARALMLRRILICALGVLGAGLACSEAAEESPHLAGTYVIALCQGECRLDDSSRALFAGRLTLVDTPLVIAQLPEAKRSYLELTSLFMTVNGPLNGCFAFHPVRATRVESHGLPYLRAPGASTWLHPVSLTRWERRAADSIWLTLYRSPDASHDVLARITNGWLEGRGSWFAAGAAEEEREGDIGADYAIGRRIGPPDIASCFGEAPELPRRVRRTTEP